MFGTCALQKTGEGAFELTTMGVRAAAGRRCRPRAYGTAAGPRNTLVVANLQYSGIVFGAIYSVLLFAEDLSIWSWMGMALIIFSGLAATFLRARSTKPASLVAGL